MFKEVMSYLASRDRGYVNTSFPIIRRHVKGYTEAQLEAVMLVLQKAGAGRIVQDPERETDYKDFIWSRHLSDVALVALGKIGDEVELREPTHKAQVIKAATGISAAPQPKASSESRQRKAAETRLSVTAASPAARPLRSEDAAEFLTVSLQVDGRPAEVELDVKKVPRTAFRSIRYLD